MDNTGFSARKLARTSEKWRRKKLLRFLRAPALEHKSSWKMWKKEFAERKGEECSKCFQISIIISFLRIRAEEKLLKRWNLQAFQPFLNADEGRQKMIRQFENSLPFRRQSDEKGESMAFDYQSLLVEAQRNEINSKKYSV